MRILIRNIYIYFEYLCLSPVRILFKDTNSKYLHLYFNEIMRSMATLCVMLIKNISKYPNSDVNLKHFFSLKVNVSN
jgi:hypothetical protein